MRSALLVDGDNISAGFAEDMLRIASNGSAPDVVRVYANLTKCKDWQTAPGFRTVHAGGAKNAADVLLAIDAMVLALRDGIQRFFIASSDGDFVHVTQRLRELGHHVTGLGEDKATEYFRAACHDFVELRRTPCSAPAPTSPPVKTAHQAIPAKTKTAQKGPTPLDLQIRGIIQEHSTQGKGMPLVVLNTTIRARHGVKVSELKERTWRAYLTGRPSLYEVDPRSSTAHVRFLPDGFRVAN